MATADRVAGAMMNTADPDLKPFFSHGGKLLMYHGWADPGIPPMFSVEYYKSVVDKTGGAKKAADSIRLFMVPGMGHCAGGEGPNTFNAMDALSQWVEKGKAPEQMVASHSTRGSVDRTRPLCPYPQVAQYKGTGSTDEAASFIMQASVIRRLVEQAFSPALLLALAATLSAADTWSEYLGSADSSQYSALKQINKSNVKQLEVVWTYPTAASEKYLCNPLIAGGVMYVQAKNNSIVALDAVTGKDLWAHPFQGPLTERGINYWENKDRSDRRLFTINGGYLTAIDARNGQTILSFGDNGRTDLRGGLDFDYTDVPPIQTNNPGRIFENIMIVPLMRSGSDYAYVPGDIHAYDVRTGKLLWQFHTIPRPGEFGYDTWPKDFWQRNGGGINWNELSIDEKRGIAYVPTGTGKWDYYGGDRVGQNLFANSTIALDARTGKRLWHFQFVHHDLWDYDLPAGPKLLTVKHDGKNVDVVIQPTKQGFLFVLDRVTGQPLWPVEERPAPKSDVPGEQSWPTQPFPTKPPPFARQALTEKDLNPYMPAEEQTLWRDRIRTARNDGLFTPPSFRGSVEIPGSGGGANWATAAVDPTKGTLYIVSRDAPTMLILVPPDDPRAAGAPGTNTAKGRERPHRRRHPVAAPRWMERSFTTRVLTSRLHRRARGFPRCHRPGSR